MSSITSAALCHGNHGGERDNTTGWVHCDGNCSPPHNLGTVLHHGCHCEWQDTYLHTYILTEFAQLQDRVCCVMVAGWRVEARTVCGLYLICSIYSLYIIIYVRTLCSIYIILYLKCMYVGTYVHMYYNMECSMYVHVL